MGVDLKIFDTLLEPTFVLDSEGRVFYCNEPASLICDVSVRKMMRSRPNICDLFQFSEKVEALSHLKEITEASPYLEVSFSTNSGRAGRVQLTIQPLPEHFLSQTETTEPPSTEANQPLWLVYFRDVTLEETLQRKYRGELEKKELVILALEEAQVKLEDYSRNLEKKVEERTEQLSLINAQMKALLDSLGQGFLIFNREGMCLEIASKACDLIFEGDPRNRRIDEVLGLDTNAAKSFKNWMTTAFSEMLPFEDLAPLAPPRYQHHGGRTIDLGYFPIRNETNAIESIVLVGTDVTELVAAQHQAQLDRAHAQLILELIKNRRQILNFNKEGEALVQEIQRQASLYRPDYAEAFRALHTLKGGAASFSAQQLVEAVHEGENLLSQWHEYESHERLHSFHDQAAKIAAAFQQFLQDCEQVLGQTGKHAGPVREIPSEKLLHFYQALPPQSSYRHEFFATFLTESCETIFSGFNDAVQSAANQLGKVVLPLAIETPNFHFWPEPYQPLLATLVHAFRNAVDHGIETPDQRELLGKSTAGKITVEVLRVDASLHILIRDDGAGVDTMKIRTRLEQKGLSCQHESDEQVIQHVFDSQFSTRDQVTALSGRGVGMDAILTAAKHLGGNAIVQSNKNQGSTIRIEVPWIEELAEPKIKAA